MCSAGSPLVRLDRARGARDLRSCMRARRAPPPGVATVCWWSWARVIRGRLPAIGRPNAEILHHGAPPAYRTRAAKRPWAGPSRGRQTGRSSAPRHSVCAGAGSLEAARAPGRAGRHSLTDRSKPSQALRLAGRAIKGREISPPLEECEERDCGVERRGRGGTQEWATSRR